MKLLQDRRCSLFMNLLDRRSTSLIILWRIPIRSDPVESALIRFEGDLKAVEWIAVGRLFCDE